MMMHVIGLLFLFDAITYVQWVITLIMNVLNCFQVLWNELANSIK